jgi:hypothetical protein
MRIDRTCLGDWVLSYSPQEKICFLQIKFFYIYDNICIVRLSQQLIHF